MMNPMVVDMGQCILGLVMHYQTCVCYTCSSGLVAVCNCPKLIFPSCWNASRVSCFPLLCGTWGVTLDQELTLSRHVGSVCRSCFYYLRQIRSVRRSLTFKAARTLMHAFICSRVD